MNRTGIALSVSTLAALAGYLLAGQGCTTTGGAKKSTPTTAYAVSPTPAPSNTHTATLVPSPTFLPMRYVYIAGGRDSAGSSVSTTYSNWLGSGGTMGSTWTGGPSVGIPVEGSQMVAHGGYLFHAGGQIRTAAAQTPTYGPVSTFAQAASAAAGTIGTWSVAATLPYPAAWGGMVAFAGHVYLFGGWDGGSVRSTVYAATISGGSVGSWSSTSALPGISAQGAYNLHIPHIYWGGGGSGGFGGAGGTPGFTATVTSTSTSTATATPAVSTTPQSSTQTNTWWTTMSSGSVSAWVSAPPLPSARRDAASAVWGDYLYYIGGADSTGAPIATVFLTNVYAGVGGMWQSTTPLPQPLRSCRAFAHNGYIYVVGGTGASGIPVSTVYVAVVNPDYTLGPWTTGPALPAARAAFAHAVGT